jgi:hypothetical protein
VLRHDEDGDAAIAPQPTLASLDALILQAKGIDAHRRGRRPTAAGAPAPSCRRS